MDMEGRSGHQDALFPTRVGDVTAPGSNGVGMGVRKTLSLNGVQTAAVAAAMLVPVMALAQYPGQVSKKSKNTPDLRAIAVLEWTGEVGKPKACRMVPVMVYDGEKLQDAGIYLARPQPLALSGEVEYELKANGKTFGFFDIENAGQEQGTWVGYGKWKPMPAPKAPEAMAPGKGRRFQDEKPVLHRKQHGAEGSGSGTKSGDSTTTSSQSPGSDDPDRPKLQKKTDDGKDTSSSTTASSPPPDDPDRPKLQKKPDTGKTSSSSPDPDRPTLQQSRPNLAQDIGDVDSVADSDPDRPRLKRGKSSGNGTGSGANADGPPARHAAGRGRFGCQEPSRPSLDVFVGQSR